MFTKRRALADRFWEKVDIRGPDECWPWLASTGERGYGKIMIHGPDGKAMATASRIAYELCFGPVHDGLQVLHSCDNPPCCNPGHLFLGTQLQNVADMEAKGRMSVGEEHPTAKLTAAQVAEIRHSHELQAVVGARFGVTQSNVSLIRSGKRWRAGLRP